MRPDLQAELQGTQALATYVQTKTGQLARRLGRPLRVLHIGNIANNAYVNAKIMRRAGIEADVLVIDYYHIMGCPEWEEGAVSRLAGTHDRPHWSASVVSGFVRPNWFVQGPAELCAAYLRAKNAGNPVAQWLRWAALNWHLNSSIGWRRHIVKSSASIRHGVAGLETLMIRQIVRAGKLPRRVARKLWRMARHTKFKSYFHKLRQATLSAGSSSNSNRRPYGSILQTSKSVALLAAALSIAVYRDVTRKARMNRRVVAWKPPPPPKELLEDLIPPKQSAWLLKSVFDYYDVVQGYSTDGIYPLLAGKRSFACYEHGTLRDMPFQNSPVGRICRYTYLNAPAVFITNTDCIAAADRLGIPKERQHPIPHAFDSDRVIHFQKEHEATCFPRNDPVTFIAPARHHWKNADMVSWLKGNDVAIRAAQLLAEQGLKFKIVFVRWGEQREESERLIADLDVGDYFEWIDPLPKQRLWQYYMSCNGVLDQFTIPAIGSVSFEALAFGRPLFTRIDEKVFKEFFGEAPPLFNVHTPKGLASAVAPLIRDPAIYRDVEEKAKRWTAQYHSSDRILKIQLDAYEKILETSLINKTVPAVGSVANGADHAK